MRSLMFAVCTAFVLLFPLRAAAQDPLHADSPRVTITVNNPMLVGNAVLKPGDYLFQCREFDGKTFLVISQVESKKEILRIPCEKESLDARNVNSELRAIVNANGTRVLQSIRIKGETIGHRIAE
jgi:hypothetical protein